MREDLLHFLWKYSKLPTARLSTTRSESIAIIDPGIHNRLSGPDFFNAKIDIDGQLWAGTVEIHLKSSDWYAHRHEDDPKYGNVILHVVWEEDTPIFRKNGAVIPTLELKDLVSPEVLLACQSLFDRRKHIFINCERDLLQVDPFIRSNWLERLFFERLERKSRDIMGLLENSKNDWEHVLFTLLLKNFGSYINGDAFLTLANHLPFSVVRKSVGDPMQLESLLFGMAHLLEDDTIVDGYYLNLKRNFEYLQRKFSLDNAGVLRPEFFKLRPSNFPTVRLSQFAHLYGQGGRLFEKVMAATDLKQLYTVFKSSVSPYWNTHYVFGKPSRERQKTLSKSFIDLLVINTVLPLKFCYLRHLGKSTDTEILQICTDIKAEQNAIVQGYEALGLPIKNAMESQALLQLYTKYCRVNRCLDCAIGSAILHRNL